MKEIKVYAVPKYCTVKNIACILKINEHNGIQPYDLKLSQGFHQSSICRLKAVNKYLGKQVNFLICC